MNAASELSDAEFAELDGLLAAVPEPLQPLDGVMLDGFLCGVIVQPSLVEPDSWLPFVFAAGGHRWGEAEPGPEQVRARELILRRLAALNRSLAELGGFDPYLYEPAADEPAAAVLAPWAAGFMAALDVLPELDALNDDAIAAAIARIERYLADEPPAGSLERGIDALVGAVVELYDRTEPIRYRVEPVRRDTPKVGRNEPCPCGSGRKFKLCHGAA